jgi:hypothetical protein
MGKIKNIFKTISTPPITGGVFYFPLIWYLCNMEISTSIKRRVSEIDSYLNVFLTHQPYFHIGHHKERYLEFISRNLSEWFVQTYENDYVTRNEYYKRVNELIPIMKYLFMTKIILHWEKMNELDSPTFS